MPKLSGYTGYTFGPEGGGIVAHEPATIAPRELWAKYIAPRRPVILDGLPLNEDDFRAGRWAHLPYLAALAGHVPVRVEPRHPTAGQFGTSMPRTTMHFGEFVETLSPDSDPEQRGKYYLTTQYDTPSDEDPDLDEDLSHDRPTDSPVRLGKRRRSPSPVASDSSSTSASSLISLTPEKDEMDTLLPAPCHALISDFPPHPELMGNLLLQQVNLWLGSTPITPEPIKASTLSGQLVGQTSGLHHDFHDNLYVLLSGEKRFTLFPPDAYPYLRLRGSVSKVHHNGLIVYDQDTDEDDEPVRPSLSDDEDDSDFENSRGNVRLVRGPPPDAGQLIRADGLPDAQAERWRVRARVRKVHDIEDAIALSRGGPEAQRARKQRKGKARMSAQLADAIEQVATARRGYELARLFESGVRPVRTGGGEAGSDSDLSVPGSSESETDTETEAESESEADPRPRKNGSSGAVRDGDESEGSVEEDELAMLLDDATGPLPAEVVAYLQQKQNGAPVQASDDESDEEEESGSEDDSGVEEDELAGLLADATEPGLVPQRQSPGKATANESEDESSEEALTKAQLAQLKARFGDPAGQTEDSDDEPDDEPPANKSRLNGSDLSSSDLQLSTPMLREAVKLADSSGPLNGKAEDDLRTLIYDVPRAWAATGAPVLEGALAAHLRKVWDLLDDAEDAMGEEDVDQSSEDEDEGDLPVLDDASMASFDPRAADDGEALLQGLAGAAGETQGKPEPPSFSRIKPADLWDHFGIVGADGQATTSKKSRNDKKGKKKHASKFEPQVDEAGLRPLPNCPAPLVAHLKPGQMLFLPASWFHEVTSYASPDPGAFHMALNYWFHPPTNTVGAPDYALHEAAIKKMTAKTTKQAAKAGSAAAAAAATAEATKVAAEQARQGTETNLPSPLDFDHPYLDTEVWHEIRHAIETQLQQAKDNVAEHSASVEGMLLTQEADRIARYLATGPKEGAAAYPASFDFEGGESESDDDVDDEEEEESEEEEDLPLVPSGGDSETDAEDDEEHDEDEDEDDESGMLEIDLNDLPPKQRAKLMAVFADTNESDSDDSEDDLEEEDEEDEQEPTAPERKKASKNSKKSHRKEGKKDPAKALESHHHHHNKVKSNKHHNGIGKLKSNKLKGKEHRPERDERPTKRRRT